MSEVQIDGVDWPAFVAERPIVVIATVSAGGGPHAVPVEVVVRDGSLWVWCRAASVKARNARREGRAAIVAYKGHAGVLVRGPATLRGTDDSLYAATTKAFLDKYERDETYGNDVLIEIRPERVSRL